jgi:hypothetical protein
VSGTCWNYFQWNWCVGYVLKLFSEEIFLIIFCFCFVKLIFFIRYNGFCTITLVLVDQFFWTQRSLAQNKGCYCFQTRCQNVQKLCLSGFFLYMESFLFILFSQIFLFENSIEKKPFRKMHLSFIIFHLILMVCFFANVHLYKISYWTFELCFFKFFMKFLPAHFKQTQPSDNICWTVIIFKQTFEGGSPVPLSPSVVSCFTLCSHLLYVRTIVLSTLEYWVQKLFRVL